MCSDLANQSSGFEESNLHVSSTPDTQNFDEEDVETESFIVLIFHKEGFFPTGI